jgi:hypothetical protein
MIKKHKPKTVRFTDECLFFDSIKERDVETFKEFLKKLKPDELDKINQLGLTPMHQGLLDILR